MKNSVNWGRSKTLLEQSERSVDRVEWCNQRRQSPLEPLCQPPPFLPSPLPPSLYFPFSSPPFPFPSLPCRKAAPQSSCRGSGESAVSVSSPMRFGAEPRPQFCVHVEPRNRVWWQRFWFFFVLRNKYKSPRRPENAPWEFLYALRVVHYGPRHPWMQYQYQHRDRYREQ